jgi:PTH1 family peptidyl-tRNA hydrolase
VAIMKIIIGLGNPGRRYDRTPHNLGFEVVDCLARRHGGAFRPSRGDQAEIAEIRIGPETLVLARPMTWMNLSGQAARELMRNRPAGLPDLLVVSDDVNLPVGRMRIRATGSAGGHNGLKSIIACLGSDGFARLRLGCRPQREIEDLAGYVLGTPPPGDRKMLDAVVEAAADATEFWVREGTEPTANKFNGYDATQEA